MKEDSDIYIYIYIRVGLACRGRRRPSRAYYYFNYINNGVLEMRVSPNAWRPRGRLSLISSFLEASLDFEACLLTTAPQPTIIREIIHFLVLSLSFSFSFSFSFLILFIFYF
jgi:hypothetical protein